MTGWNMPPGCTSEMLERASGGYDECEHPKFGPDGYCEDCGEFDEGHVDPNYDPTPWCAGCGAMKKSDCHCGPLADND